MERRDKKWVQSALIEIITSIFWAIQNGTSKEELIAFEYKFCVKQWEQNGVDNSFFYKKEKLNY